MKPATLPLPWKLSLVPAAVALLMVTAVAALADRLFAGHLEDRARGEVALAASALADVYSRALSRRAGEVQLLARHAALQPGGSPARMRQELEWLQQHTAGYAWLGVTDASGLVIAATGDLLQGESIASRPVFREGIGAPWMGDVHPAVALAPLLPPAPGGGVPRLIDFAAPIRDAEGRAQGVLAAHVDVDWFDALRLEQRPEPAPAGLRTAVLSREGEVLLGALPPPLAQALVAALAGASPPMQVFELLDDGARQLVAARPLDPPDGPLALGWRVIAVQDHADALAPLTALQRNLVVGGLLAALGLGLAGWLLSRRLAQPYAGLLDAVTERFASAAGQQRARGLTAYLDAMAEELRGRPPPPPGGAPLTGEEVLSRVVGDAQRLRAILDQLATPVYLVSPADRVLYWNPACEAMFGWAADEALGRRTRELFGEPRAGTERVRERVAGEHGPVAFAAAVQRRDGSLAWGEWRLDQIHGRDGEPLGVLAQVIDVSAERAARAEASALEHRLTLLTDAAVDYALVLLDPAGRVLSFNAGAERLTGHRTDEVLGREHTLFYDDAEGASGGAARLLEQAARAGRVEFEGWCRRRDGARFWGDVVVYRLGDPGAPPTGYAQITRDLSARHEADKQRHESEARLAAVIQSASDAVISTDVSGRIELFNPAAERIFGRRATTVLGERLDLLLPPGQRERHGADLAAFAASKVTRRSMGAGRVQGLRADGTLVELEASISQVQVNERQVLTAILRDVTERVRAEQALLQYQHELTALTQRLMAQEKMTTRLIAQSLHDQLGQTLAAIRLGLDALPAGGAPRERLDALVAQAIREVRQVLAELRPPLLDEQGLAAALDNELRARRPLPEGVELLLDVAPALAMQRWPGDVEYAAFMVAREAIGNALLHAGAALVRVAIEGDARRLHLEVADDGRGLAPEFAGGRPGHLGLVGMRERAVAIGALFEVLAPPGEGTTVRLSWEESES